MNVMIALASRLSPLAVCAGVLLLPLVISLPAKAQAEEAQAGIPQSSPEHQDKSGWYLDLTLLATLGQIAIGHDYGRTRIEGGFYAVAETGTIDGEDYTAFISSLMMNFYTDLGSPEARWSPYAGVGLGYGKLGITDGNVTLTTPGGFSYRVSGGLTYAFNKSLDGNILIGYQGLFVDEIGAVDQFGGGLGLRVRF